MSQRAVIVGSGMAGLTSAILLAMRGWQVTVLEQHNRPGGMLQQFHRGRWTFDTGFHYCGGVSRGDALGRVLRHLGVFDELEFLALDRDGFDRIVFPDLSFDVPVGVTAYRERLRETFPHEATGIDSFIDALNDAVNAYGMYRGSSNADFKQVMKVEGTSLMDVVRRHVRDPRLIGVICGQGVLYGVPPSDAPFGIHALVLHHFLQGAHRLRGGGQALVDALVRRLEQLGGELRLRSRATGILVDDRDVQGVTLASGEQLRGELVLSSMHPRLLLELLPPGAVRPAFARRVRDQRVGTASAGIYLALDGPSEELATRNIYRWMGWDVDAQFASCTPERMTHYVALGGARGRSLAGQAGGHSVLMTFLLDYEQVRGWAGSRPNRRHEDYQQFKEAMQQRAVDSLLEDLPGLRGHVVAVEASTGLSTEHYTFSPQGAMYGHYHSVDQMGRYRPSQATRVRGLIQIGQAVFAPGVLGASLSAYYGLSGPIGLETLVREMEVA